MNRYLSIIASTLLLLLGAAIFYIKWNSSTTNPNPVPPDNQSINTPNISKEEADYRRRVEEEGAKQLKQRDQVIVDLEIANKSISSQNPDQCNEIVNEETKKMCLEQAGEALAMKEKNIAGCERIADSQKRDLCKDKIYIIQARVAMDATICDMIGQVDLRNKCIEEVESKMYLSQNKNSTGGALQKDCSTYTNSGIIAQCKHDTQFQQDYKLIYTALSNEDNDVCGQIVDKKLKQDCSNGILLTQAKEALDISKCEKLTDDSMKLRCKTTISSLLDTKTIQDAIKSKNIEMCLKVESDKLRNNCVDKIRLYQIMQSRKIEECDNLRDASLQETCKKSLGNN